MRNKKVDKKKYYSEQLHFDKEYEKISKDEENLIIPTSEIGRYRNPDSCPLYGRVFSFYLLGDVSNKKVLDYGCGDGDNAVFLAKKGALVTAIDCSNEAIELTRAKAKANGVDGSVEVIKMDAERTCFTDMEFDIVLGNAILHHLDLERTREEICRILKHGGIAIFREPIVGNVILKVLRKLIPIYPSNPTKEERPLTYKDLRFFGERFSQTDWWEFEIFSRVNYLIKNISFIHILHRIDYILMQKFPFTRKLASCVVVRYIK